MKEKLFCDIDETLTASVRCFLDVYNSQYANEKGFIPVTYHRDMEPYRLYDYCTLLNSETRDADKIFGCKEFFDRLVFIEEGTYDSLKRISKHFDIIICSIGIPSNIKYKREWVNEHLPFIKETAYIVDPVCKMDKSSVNMKDAWFLDDVASNLFSSNAKYKACFGNITETNVTWVSKRCFDWNDVESWLGV